MKVDVLIVGAGLAGLSAAAQIAAYSRAEVIVLERLMIGSNNPTPLIFADVLPRFGLESCALGRYHRYVFHSPLGNCSAHTFNHEPLVALAYQQACLSLLERANTAGNVWMYSAAALGLQRDRDCWRVRLNDGQELEARLVIDASGRGLFTSRALKLPRPRYFSHCYGARLANCNIPDPGEVFFFAPCEAYGNGGGWLYPLEGGQASYGWATLSNTPSLPGGIVKENFRRALGEFEPYAGWLRDARREHIEVGSIPIFPLRRFVYDGLLIAGDSAGQATTWTYMGSEAALVAGKLAGETAVTALQRGNFSAASLASYQQRWDHHYRDIYRRNGWVAPVVWSMGETDWNRLIPKMNALSPDEMLAKMRVNWPVPTLPQAVFIRSYDLIGRARRGFIRRLKGMVGRPAREQIHTPSKIWTRANVGEVLPHPITPLTWAVFRATLENDPDGVWGRGSSQGLHQSIRLYQGRVYVQAGLVLESFSYLPGVTPQVVQQALGIELPPHHTVPNRRTGSLRVRSAQVAFLLNCMGLLPRLEWLARRLPVLPAVSGTDQSGVEQNFHAEIQALVEWTANCFHLHLKTTAYAIGAFALLINRYERYTGGDPARLYGLLRGQADLQTAAQGVWLQKLAESARTSPDLMKVLVDAQDWKEVVSGAAAAGRKDFLLEVQDFLVENGARAAGEFELATPRWREDPAFVLDVVRKHLDGPVGPSMTDEKSQAEALEAMVAEMASIESLLFYRLLASYRRFSDLREGMKYRLIEGYAALRQTFLSWAKALHETGRLELVDDIFYLSPNEILALQRGEVDPQSLHRQAGERRREREHWEEQAAPELLVGDLPAQPGSIRQTDGLVGIPCSPGLATGKARVLLDIAQSAELQPGEILVTPHTDPGWTPLFLSCQAVVTELGGFLSHGATVAREYGLPCVSSVHGAVARIRTGDLICVDGTNGSVKVL